MNMDFTMEDTLGGRDVVCNYSVPNNIAIVLSVGKFSSLYSPCIVSHEVFLRL